MTYYNDKIRRKYHLPTQHPYYLPLADPRESIDSAAPRALRSFGMRSSQTEMRCYTCEEFLGEHFLAFRLETSQGKTI